jgi:uncharacterized iron-regulated protein
MPTGPEAFTAKEAMLKEVQSLRELVFQALTHERELTTLELQKLNKQIDTAANELSRRLDTLNHAHEASLVDRASFLNVEVYNANQKDITKWRDEVNAILNNSAGRAVAYSGIMSLFVGLLAVLISHFWK